MYIEQLFIHCINNCSTASYDLRCFVLPNWNKLKICGPSKVHKLFCKHIVEAKINCVIFSLFLLSHFCLSLILPLLFLTFLYGPTNAKQIRGGTPFTPLFISFWRTLSKSSLTKSNVLGSTWIVLVILVVLV